MTTLNDLLVDVAGRVPSLGLPEMGTIDPSIEDDKLSEAGAALRQGIIGRFMAGQDSFWVDYQAAFLYTAAEFSRRDDVQGQIDSLLHLAALTLAQVLQLSETKENA